MSEDQSNEELPTEQPAAKQLEAIALGFDGNQAPEVLAKGYGLLAEEIINEAQAHGIHIHQDPALAAFLQKIELGEEIPKELFTVIAELIAFSYLLQGKMPEFWKTAGGGIGAKV
ncbi:flagellar biosynthesis protein FlhB [Corallincola luteus]|uniref:Flagellar biosynthetic protein FlhB n=1 Tax=Corallincola luteus TaxID=1775177 RepID=A0ABY2AQC7_9GAMM|nr:EscU/YscU/HrcU family type III secretion system export apparatus switch protein [Corallincola luteus]TCI05403.1 flagellar biosynthesis protein FlhB [Corallincola luteus]